ncbi:MAG: adenylyltransferase/cytidyltransferase family protein [Oscillospiraceae bacterium]|nr:adenylyltransferase/cytidyltransferase family protein [Oscillospiraceae bacterium]
MSILLHNMAILGVNGGSIFDYYIDKGVKKLNIFAAPKYIDVLKALAEQAFWLDIEIAGLYSTEEKKIKLKFMEKTENNERMILNIQKSKPEDGIPFITLAKGKTTVIASENQRFSDLKLYSHIKNVIFEKALKYKKEFAPNLKIAICSFPNSHQIKNPNNWEKNATKPFTARVDYQKLPEYYRKQGWTEEEIEVLTTSKRYKMLGSFCKWGTRFLADINYPHIHANSGYRVTTDNPANAENTIFTFGASTTLGLDMFDEYTLPSVIQRELRSHFGEDFNYATLNCASGGWTNFNSQINSFLYHQPKDNDVAIFIIGKKNVVRLLSENYKSQIAFIEPHHEVGMFDRPHNHGDCIYANTQSHFTNIGSEILGKYYAKRLIEHGVFEKSDENITPVTITPQTQSYFTTNSAPLELVQFLQKTKQVAPQIGSIVMNCNPFTLGHRYLIEESAKKVSQLIIFVVEEDKSVFPFVDRLELVRKGTADLPNVTVVPSGGFIISQTTFGEYFEKDSKQELKVDPTQDLEIYAQHIAPALGITKRFAGEEPLDLVTRQYNDAMQRILPKYGIEFDVIPRKDFGGEVISASRVRKLLETKDFDSIKNIVPTTTLEYLQERFG